MSVYTKTGDSGQTSLLSRQRVWKDDARVEAYGTVDEASSAIGLAKTLLPDSAVQDMLQQIQLELIELSGDLAEEAADEAKPARISHQHVASLESWIDQLERRRIPQHYFVTPGGSPASAALDLARTVVRRAERACVHVRQSGRFVATEVSLYLNRLSDFLFVLARCTEQQALIEQVKAAVRKVLAEQTPAVCAPLSILDRARKIMEAAEYKAMEIGVPMVLTVVDESGQVVAQHRMDGSLLASISISLDKAYTAAALKMSTEQAAELAGPGKPLYGINTAAGGRLIVFGGGLPIIEQGIVVGGFGVSGGSVQEDVLVAKAGLAAL